MLLTQSPSETISLPNIDLDAIGCKTNFGRGLIMYNNNMSILKKTSLSSVYILFRQNPDFAVKFTNKTESNKIFETDKTR